MENDTSIILWFLLNRELNIMAILEISKNFQFFGNEAKLLSYPPGRGDESGCTQRN